MILLVVVASILIAAVTILQFNKQSRDYHEERLERKESHLILNLNYFIEEAMIDNLINLPQDKINEITDIHEIPFEIYSLQGQLLKTSLDSKLAMNDIILSPEILLFFKQGNNTRYVENNDESKYSKSSYNLIYSKNQPVGIMHMPYFMDDSLSKKELKAFLMNLGIVYVNMLLIAFVLAYFLSNYITKSLTRISQKIKATTLNKENAKIDIDRTPKEVSILIDSYNTMIDDLEESAVKLAKSERETAWREMAKQVAHEIKNPLTPMRLSIQSFQKNYSSDDKLDKTKLKDFSNSLIEQIDTMSSIATAFSDFANMPEQKKELLNVTEVVQIALDIFNKDYIEYSVEEKEILTLFDRTQLIRVITNLINNAIQAIPENRSPIIKISVASTKRNVVINIEDNGNGISEKNRNKIFEPSFTTKSSGMGLGLSMIQSIMLAYNGSITFKTKENQGTIFKMVFPKKIK
ncbi:MAG: ATP-binding protein [Flavobacteriaceae bacterium]|jgi:nitrogen fixation/metabolism regulation signal transduction histidine kinase|nr:ATP-binding protein [Flavobacteriaceae bacterium]